MDFLSQTVYNYVGKKRYVLLCIGKGYPYSSEQFSLRTIGTFKTREEAIKAQATDIYHYSFMSPYVPRGYPYMFGGAGLKRLYDSGKFDKVIKEYSDYYGSAKPYDYRILEVDFFVWFV